MMRCAKRGCPSEFVRPNLVGRGESADTNLNQGSPHYPGTRPSRVQDTPCLVLVSGRDIQLTIGIAGNTQPRPTTT